MEKFGCDEFLLRWYFEMLLINPNKLLLINEQLTLKNLSSKKSVSKNANKQQKIATIPATIDINIILI